MYQKLEYCRLSGSPNLVPILSLGHQALTGIFPSSPAEKVTVGPLELVWCPDSGLVQLAHTYDAAEMYGDNYGYRSGLNNSMVRHLGHKIRQLEKSMNLTEGDVVLDIGSNDATSLKSYQTSRLKRIGIDPTGKKFQKYYSDDMVLVPDFFSESVFRSASPKEAKVVTSIAMLYDLESPVKFAVEVRNILASDGIWHFEQSYLPSMLRTCSYDTICHEHLEYYSLQSIQRILSLAGLKILDVEMNSVNGGSFAVTATHQGSARVPNQPVIEWLLSQEDRMGINSPKLYRDFEERVYRHREDLKRLLNSLRHDGKRVLGYGASTKGNVLLQFCGIGSDTIEAIAEVNSDKFGHYTPGTKIPIVSEEEARAMKPDYFLVLPWHFKENILAKEEAFRAAGGKFIFPLPEIEIV